jgi:Cysteine-rich secretory protein family
MHRNARLLAVLAAVLVVAVAPSSGSAGPRGTMTPATQLQVALLGQINALRSSRGLVRLKLSPALSAAANGHSAQMARLGYFSHNSANGTSFSQRISSFYPARGFRSWSVGENLVCRPRRRSLDERSRRVRRRPGDGRHRRLRLAHAVTRRHPGYPVGARRL